MCYKSPNYVEQEKLIKSIRNDEVLIDIYIQSKPKRKNKMLSILSEKYGHEVAGNLKDDVDTLFQEIYEIKKFLKEYD